MSIDINKEIHNDFIIYAEAVNNDRAFPSAKDGLKPVQRACLWEMYHKGYTSNKPHVKSAKIVGGVIGSWHPHGDCLEANTKVFLLDGSEKTIKELFELGEDQWVIAVDETTNKLVAAKATNFRIGQYTNKIYRIHLSNGGVIECTGNHPFRLSNGSWVNAEDLHENMILDMVDIYGDDYKSLKYYHNEQSNVKLHQLVANQFNLNTKDVIHHKNRNTFDNRPENLIPLTRAEHAEEHKDYLEGLELGRVSMFSPDSEMRERIIAKNSWLMNQMNKHMPMIKIQHAFEYLTEHNLDLTIANYEQLRTDNIIYNLTTLNWLSENNLVFEDLVNQYKSTGKVFAYDEYESTKPIKEKHFGYENDVTYWRLLCIIHNYEKTNYEKDLTRDDIKNSSGVYSFKDFTTEEFDELKKQLSIIDNIEIVEVNNVPMYDFTVDIYHNMLIGGFDGHYVVAHNSAAYGAMVGMSQPWVRNIPEVDFHGANGSLQGGPDAASSRYTEARLSKASEKGFFSTVKQNTVDFIPNFSEDEEWPKVFPAIFPRLFVNGSSGIGYTIANDWPLGNLKEYTEKVKQYVKSKKVDCKNIYPDYPTGGIIINKKDIENIYKTGRGSIIVRAKTEVKEKSIFITELPYQVYAEAVISKIKELVNAGTLEGIDDIYNKSGKEGLNIEIVCNKNVDPNVVLNKLFRLTDLQCTYNANQMAIVDKTPVLLTLQDYIKVYYDHNIDCIQREYKFELDKAIARKEIVEGLLKALVSIDDIIKCIKKSKDSDDAKVNLQKKFGFTENQAAAIVAMRLGRLAHLEAIELDKENQDLQNTIDDCNDVLSSIKRQEKILVTRLDDFTNEFGWERRTQLDDIDIVAEKKEVTKNVVKTKKEFMMILTTSNTIKRVLITNYKHITSGIEKELMSAKVQTGGKVNLISNKGNHYKMSINKVPVGLSNSTGLNLKDLLKLDSDEIIIGLYNKELDNPPFLIFITKKGLSKKVKTDTILKIGKTAATKIMKLDEDDRIIYCSLIKEKDTLDITTSKKSYHIDTSKLKDKGRGAGGNKLIKLKGDEEIETVE